MSRRHFTVAEANELLPTIREIIQGFKEAVGELEQRRSMLMSDVGAMTRPAVDTPVDPNHFTAIALFHHSLGRIQGLGVEVKDVNDGLVDFPALLDDKEILLCWKEGEDRVAFYHDRESGFAGRKPVAEIEDRLTSDEN